MSIQLKQMLAWKRPSGSQEAEWFGETYLEPLFGKANKHGNYIRVIGKDPKIAFAAHYDTVHKDGGLQRVVEEENHLYAEDSDCLGADCTTGIYIMMQLMKEGIPGVYCVFADEEIGCLGSSAEAADLVNDPNHQLSGVDAMISFDRFGTSSIITHQMGVETASDEFAKSLAAELEMNLEPDPGGSYTDSNEFSHIIPECTNLSVGYYKQHTSNETQDLIYLEELIYNLKFVEWDKLVIARDPKVHVMTPTQDYDEEADLLECVVYENIDGIAELLSQLGYTADSLIDELQVEHPWYSWGRHHA